MVTSAGRSSGSDFITLVAGVAGVDVVAGLTGAAGVAGVEGEETSSIWTCLFDNNAWIDRE